MNDSFKMDSFEQDSKTRLTWEYQLITIDNSDELSSQEKEHAKKAFENLKIMLGKDFLSDILKIGHPLYQYFFYRETWRKKWLWWISDTLFILKDLENYSILISRLKSSDRCDEVISILEVIDKFNSTGLHVELEKETVLDTERKVPDLHIKDNETNEDFYVEVSIINKSVDRLNNDRLTEYFFYTNPFITWSGMMFKNVKEKKFLDFEKEVQSYFNSANTEQKFIEFEKKGVIKIAFAPDSERLALNKWADDNNLRVGSLYVPMDNFIPSGKIRRKIRGKRGQLLLPLPNILFLKMDDTLSLYMKNRKWFTNQIKNTAKLYENIYALVIDDTHWGSPQESLQKIEDGILFLSRNKGRADLIVNNSFIFLNPNFKLNISNELKSKIYNALTYS